MALCEDFPSCGHTPFDPCERQTYDEQPTGTWTCDCGEPVVRFRGQGDVDCPHCGQSFNAFGQRLRADWPDNPSTHDDEIGDLEGYELAHADDH